jgi:ABC-type phosphate/phosphonate transport system substrate-binding protein
MARLAGLPMYDLPEVRAATDDLWRGLARAFRREGLEGVPDRLRRDIPAPDLALHPDLLFAQTCGYPLTHRLAGRVRLVATPCYGARGCQGPHYTSLIVVRADERAGAVEEFEHRTAAVNALDSHSGCHALRALVAPLATRDGRFFDRTLVTGSHRSSIAAVRSGEADLAAIDGVIHGLLERHAPGLLDGTRVLGMTPAAPGLPFVCADGTAADDLLRLRAGLVRAMADPDLRATRDSLLITDVEVLPLVAYERILELERSACTLPAWQRAAAVAAG